MDFLDYESDRNLNKPSVDPALDDILAEFAASEGEKKSLWSTDAAEIGYDAKVYSPKNKPRTAPDDKDVKLYEKKKRESTQYIDLREKRVPDESREEFDSRYYMGERPKKSEGVSYGGRTVTLDADEDYTPPQTPEASHELWPDRVEEPKDEKSLRGKAKRLFRKYRQVEKLQAEDIAAQAAKANIPQDDAPPEEDEFLGDDGFPKSFKEYVTTLAMGLIYKVRGTRQSTVTVDDSDEQLGSELRPGDASEYYSRAHNSLKNRTRIAAVLLLFMLWVSLGLPVSGMLKTVKVASLFLMANQLAVMLLALDVVANAARRTVELRPGADTLAVIGCIFTTLDAILVAAGSVAAHIPLCALSSLSLFAVLLSSTYSAKALRKTLRVPFIAKHCYTVTGETDSETGDVTLVKTVRGIKGFVRRSEEAAPDEELYQKLFYPLGILSVLFAFLTALIKHSFGDLVFILSAMLAAATPLGALLSFALPYWAGVKKIFKSGAAIAGWSGLLDVGKSRSLIITDRDIFPEGTVELGEMRAFAEFDARTIVTYAGSVITSSGSCLAKPFAELMHRFEVAPERAENVQYMPSGGIQASINGNTVLCGNSDLMRLMNVKVPFRLVGPTTVLLAINGILFGIFNVKYKADPKVREALVAVMRSNRHPVFAIRDFNVTPAMLRELFDVATDGYDFPTYPDRFRVSSGSPGSSTQVAALVCREGLGPLCHMADTGRNMYLKVRISILLSCVSAFLGLIIVFAKLAGAGCVTFGFMLLWAVLWLIPTVVMSFLTK